MLAVPSPFHEQNSCNMGAELEMKVLIQKKCPKNLHVTYVCPTWSTQEFECTNRNAVATFDGSVL